MEILLILAAGCAKPHDPDEAYCAWVDECASEFGITASEADQLRDECSGFQQAMQDSVCLDESGTSWDKDYCTGGRRIVDCDECLWIEANVQACIEAFAAAECDAYGTESDPRYDVNCASLREDPPDHPGLYAACSAPEVDIDAR